MRPHPPGKSPAKQEIALSALVPAIRSVRTQMAELVSRPGSLFQRSPPQGYLRGIDVYPASTLLQIAAVAAYRYERTHGTMPNLVAPARLSEKIFWSNYFRPLKVPQTGDKLETGFFLPEELRPDIRLADVMWRSPAAQLPGAADIERGTYYLKTNHGSDMFRRIEWPLTNAQRAELERDFSGYLQRPYGHDTGEWWYNKIRREVFLERSVSSDPAPIAWCCYTFRQHVALVIAYRKTARGSETVWLEPDFTPSAWQNPSKRRLRFQMPSAAVRETMLQAAAAIGRPFGFVRVDFLLGDEDQVYLSELTFSPGNATTPWPAELDLRLGALWRGRA